MMAWVCSLKVSTELCDSLSPLVWFEVTKPVEELVSTPKPSTVAPPSVGATPFSEIVLTCDASPAAVPDDVTGSTRTWLTMVGVSPAVAADSVVVPDGPGSGSKYTDPES